VVDLIDVISAPRRLPKTLPGTQPGALALRTFSVGADGRNPTSRDL